MPLTDIAIRNAKPAERPVKLSDGGGMFLLVTPAGGKLWRLKYRIDGREKLLAMGSYPETGLSDARKRREEARTLIAEGKDPSREKQRAKVRARADAGNSFKAIAAEYCAKRRRDGVKGWSQLRNDRPWLPRHGIHPAERKRHVAPRRHRTRAGARR